MATPTILWYWVPSDGDDEDHPNAYPIKRAQKDVRLGDVRAVRTPVCSHVGLLSRCLALAVGCGRRRTGACGQSQRLHSSDMLMCRLPPYHSSTHTAPFLERSHACVCVLSLLSLSLSLFLQLVCLGHPPSSLWARVHVLSISAGNGVYVLPSPPAHSFCLLAPLRARACPRSASHTLCSFGGLRPPRLALLVAHLNPTPLTLPNFSPTPPHHRPPPPPPTTRRSRSRGRTTSTLNRRT